MNSKTCKKIRKQSKIIFAEWFKTLLPEEQTAHVNEKNILTYLSSQTHLFTNNQMILSAYSFKWMNKKLKNLIKKTNMDVTIARLKDIEQKDSQGI